MIVPRSRPQVPIHPPTEIVPNARFAIPWISSREPMAWRPLSSGFSPPWRSSRDEFRRCPPWMPPLVLVLTLVDLAQFGVGLNPAIAAEMQDFEPPVIRRLRQELPPEGRAIGLGEELPPGVLMRFGLSDPRNYDSVELASSLAWFDSIYDPSESGRSSRRMVNWESVIRARQVLRDSGVGAIVSATPPPSGAFERVEKCGRVWIAWLDARPWAEASSKATDLGWSRQPGPGPHPARRPRGRSGHRAGNVGPGLGGPARRAAPRDRARTGPIPVHPNSIRRTYNSLKIRSLRSTDRILDLRVRAGGRDSQLDGNPAVF